MFPKFTLNSILFLINMMKDKAVAADKPPFSLRRGPGDF